ncbi:MAG: RNA-binding protein [Phycisphaerae bacterium]|nr:RNA-binding protein [Phycisphaerae bacterium]
MKSIYVGNLPYGITEEQLGELFASYGAVSRASIITDKMTGRSRGFGFVEMTDDGQAQAAIEGLNGTQVDGRSLTVNEARPKSGGRGDRNGGRRAGYGRDR